MPSHFEAARGAYVLRPYRDGQPRMGVVLVQGTSTTHNLTKVLDKLDEEGLNGKIVAAVSPQLFALQHAPDRDAVYAPEDRLDAMAITNRSRRLMSDWIDPGVSASYTLSSDWDNRWRTGGSVEEVMEEAHLSPQHILEGIRKFAADRDHRLGAIKQRLDRLGAGE